MTERYRLDQVSIRMVHEAPLLSAEQIRTPEDAVRILGAAFKAYDREVVGVVHLRNDNAPINMTIASIGCLNQSLVHPREMLKAAFLSNAAAVMMFHNHPSGDLTPSREDIAITDRMQQICSLAGMPLLDHIIIGNDSFYYSFQEKNILPMNEVHYTTKLEDIDLRAAEKKTVEYGYSKAGKTTECGYSKAGETTEHGCGKAGKAAPRKSIKASLAEKKKMIQGRKPGVSAVRKTKEQEL